MPSVAYLHLGTLFGSVCMTSDVLSLGYVALFLVGCATLSERSVWAVRTNTWPAFLPALSFARGGGLLLNLYVVGVLCFSVAAFLFHAAVIWAKESKTSDDDPKNLGSQDTSAALGSSKDGRIFVALISMGLDAMTFGSTAALAKADRVVECKGAQVLVQEMVLVRHTLAALTVSLNPCALSVMYLVYILVHLWSWTLGYDGGGGMWNRVGYRALLLSHKMLGYYAGLHLFLIYLFGATLENVTITITCPIASTLGLVCFLLLPLPIAPSHFRSFSPSLSKVLCIALSPAVTRITASSITCKKNNNAPLVTRLRVYI